MIFVQNGQEIFNFFRMMVPNLQVYSSYTMPILWFLEMGKFYSKKEVKPPPFNSRKEGKAPLFNSRKGVKEVSLLILILENR